MADERLTAGAPTIRVATLSDISALERMFQRSYARLLAADYPPSVLVTAIPIFTRAHPDLVRSGLYYVAETAEGRLVGAGGWSLQPPSGRPGQRGLGHVRHMAVDPDSVARGVGRSILSHTMNVAKASGMARLSAMSTRTAVPFYTRMGFVAEGETELSLPGGLRFPVEAMTAQL